MNERIELAATEKAKVWTSLSRRYCANSAPLLRSRYHLESRGGVSVAVDCPTTAGASQATAVLPGDDVPEFETSGIYDS
jgi:hypothetical protein